MRRSQKGAALLEFALTLPVLLLLLGMIVDISLYIARSLDIMRAAHEGARIGSITLEGSAPTGTVIRNAANTQALTILTQSGLSCGTGCIISSRWYLLNNLHYLEVNVQYPYTPLIGFTSLLSSKINASFTVLTQQQ